MDRLEELALMEDALETAAEHAGAIGPEIASIVPLTNVRVENGRVRGADQAVLEHRKEHPLLYRGFEQMTNRQLREAEDQFLRPGETQAPPRSAFSPLDASRLNARELAELEKTLTSAGGGGGVDVAVLRAALARQRAEDAGVL